MVNNNQESFDKKYPKKRKEIEFEDKKFEGQLVVEDYPELEGLYLQNIKSIDKVILRNLTQLQECTIWDCDMKELMIENCPQIKELKVRKNLLTSLEFIKDLENLESLELDGNDKLSKILEPYEDDWKAYQKDLQKSNKDTNTLELLESIQVLKKEKEFLNIKYDELKKFLKGILVSLSQEEKNKLDLELDKKIKRKESITAPGQTKELILNTKKVIKSIKEIKEELKDELTKAKTRIQELEKELVEQNSLYQKKEIELSTQKMLAEELKKQWISAIQESAKSEPVEKEKWEKESKELEKKLDETKKREYELEGELKAKREEIERMNEIIKEVAIVPKFQNIQHTVIGSQSINTYQIQYNIRYQQLEAETEKQIVESLTDKEISPQEQKVINKTILFLGTKELFINYRQNSINNLIECYNKLEKRLGSKLSKFITASSMMNITGKLASIIPGGGVAEVPAGIIGDTINLTGTIIKEKDLTKFTKVFQEILAKDKKNLSLFDGNYLSLISTIWEDNKTSQGEIVSTIINTLNLVKTDLSPFSNDYNAFSQSISGIWQSRSFLELEEMKNSIEAVVNNFNELKKRLKSEKEELSKQSWFKVIEEKADLLQQHQSQIQIPPK